MSSPDLWARLRRVQELAGQTLLTAYVHTVTRELTLFANEASLHRLASDPEAVSPADLPAYIALLQLELLETVLDDPQRGAAVAEQLRTISAATWEDFWLRQEAHSVLLRDPAGAYAHCDPATRAGYFAALDDVARRSSKSTADVATAAWKLSLDAGAHVGEFLIGGGRSRLERELGCRMSPASFIRARPTHFYAGAVGLLTAAGLILTATSVTAAMAALLSIPIVSLSVDLVNCIVAAFFYPPPRLPKLIFPDGVPDEYRTAVALPVIIHGEQDIDALAAGAEANYLANADRNIVFVFLTDFADAATEHTHADAPLLDALTSRTRELNRRHGRDGFQPFILLHRQRTWNPVAGLWMGWERKRGKLAEFHRFLVEELDSVKFVITLDADTRMPSGSAARLIGTLAHPLNAPFTVLQPRMKALPGASGVTFFDTWFPITAGLSAGAGVFWSCRYDIQEVYNALFGDCLYCGKGIYARRFHESICLPDNAVLSHDHIEGMHGRAGLASDVILLESYSANLLTHLQAYHRWTRGDWQLLPWLLGIVSPRDCSARLSFNDRWRLFENLRWTLLPVAIFAAIATSWWWLPSRALLLTAALLLCYTNQTFLQPLASFIRAALRRTSWRRATIEASEAFTRQAVRSVLVVAFLPYEVVITIDAVGRALYRMIWSRKKLLEWKTMAQAGRAIGSRMTSSFTWRAMFPGTLIVLLLAALAGRRGQPAWMVISLLTLWLAAPQIAYWTAIPFRRTSPPRPAHDPAE